MIDPFDTDLLSSYGDYCRRHGHVPFSIYRDLWHAAEAVMKIATFDDRDPFATTPDEVLDYLLNDPGH